MADIQDSFDAYKINSGSFGEFENICEQLIWFIHKAY